MSIPEQPFDYRFPYPSRRMPLMARNGAVATSHPLAAMAGLRMLQAGGNAIDAAVAAAAALTVVEPTSNGLGSDAFALLWDGEWLHGLNGSGRSPAALTRELLVERGYDRIPAEGWLPVTVPGAVSAWVALVERFGSMPLTELLKPAIEYAEKGHAVPPVAAQAWAAAARRLGGRRDFREAFLPGGRAPRAGELFRLAEHGRSLRSIAESDGESFYRGELAEAIARHAEREGGLLTRGDLARHRSEWVTPIRAAYRGYDVWELPPNAQGIAALMALQVLDGFDDGDGGATELPGPRPDLIVPNEARRTHRLIEALKLAFADAHAYVADPSVEAVPSAALLDPNYATARRKLIGDEALSDPVPGIPHKGDTVYLCAADRDGRMVSFIQSNFQGFGSGVVVPGTGISLQNRGVGFHMEEGHPNRVAPRKRPFHTIIPAFLTRGGTPLAAFGVMGGGMQPQGHVQVVRGMIDGGLNPQAVLDAPRVRILGGRRVAVEPEIDPQVRRALTARGHEVSVGRPEAEFGGGQIIWRDPESGTYICGSEPRKDGIAVGW